MIYLAADVQLLRDELMLIFMSIEMLHTFCWTPNWVFVRDIPPAVCMNLGRSFLFFCDCIGWSLSSLPVSLYLILISIFYLDDHWTGSIKCYGSPGSEPRPWQTESLFQDMGNYPLCLANARKRQIGLYLCLLFMALVA